MRTPVAHEVHWVRAVEGWERPEAWAVAPPSQPALHPLVLAAGQLLASLLGLMLAAEGTDQRACAKSLRNRRPANELARLRRQILAGLAGDDMTALGQRFSANRRFLAREALVAATITFGKAGD